MIAFGISDQRIIESQNHKVVWFGRDFKDRLVPTPPTPGRVANLQIRSLRVPSSLASHHPIRPSSNRTQISLLEKTVGIRSTAAPAKDVLLRGGSNGRNSSYSIAWSMKHLLKSLPERLINTTRCPIF